jgi:putative ABC transport system permease protein
MRGVPLARRNLLHDRHRALLSTGSLAVAFVLVLVLQGVFAGAVLQVTTYLRTLPADVIVSQRDVKTMHMSDSALPASSIDAVRAVPGVQSADAIRFTTSTIRFGSGRRLSYVIGYDTRARLGGPHQLRAGQPPNVGEVVIDQVAADQLHAKIGNTVFLLDRAFRISGLSTGGTSMINTTAFIRTQDFAASRGPAVSYVLVVGRPGVRPAQLADRIMSSVAGTTAQTRPVMVGQEGHVIRDMSADVMQMMTIIGLLIALAVVALTLFTTTLSKLREYAVVKALGAGPTRLVRSIVGQAGWAITLAFATSLVLTAAIGAVMGALNPTISIVIEPGAALRLAISALVVGVIGAVVPLQRVLRLDPASAFGRTT